MKLGILVYAACVDFHDPRGQPARGSPTADTNAFMFFVLWPAVTVGLAIVVVVQRRALRRR